MELKWLKDFLSLVDTRNFTRSAELRFTTQPAFSRRIRSLEEWMGAALIERSTQPISLTPAGQTFRPVAEEILRRLYQVREEVQHLSSASANSVSLAATHSLSLNFFPRWIRTIEEHKGAMFTRLDSNHAENCVQALLKGHVHFLLCHAHPSVDLRLPVDSFTSISVGTDQLIPVSIADETGPPVHKLPGSKGHSSAYLAYAGTSAIGRAVSHLLETRTDKAHLEEVFVSHLAAVLESMVRAGRGLAWLPLSHISEDLQQGRLVPAGDSSWIVPLDIRLYRSKDGLPPKSEEFWSAAQAGEAFCASREAS